MHRLTKFTHSEERIAGYFVVFFDRMLYYYAHFAQRNKETHEAQRPTARDGKEAAKLILIKDRTKTVESAINMAVYDVSSNVFIVSSMTEE